jgi:hypothetical protein
MSGHTQRAGDLIPLVMTRLAGFEVLVDLDS